MPVPCRQVHRHYSVFIVAVDAKSGRKRIKHMFGCAAFGIKLANLHLVAPNCDFLIATRRTIIYFKGKPYEKRVEPEKTKDRPGAHYQKQHARQETRDCDKTHQNDEPGTTQRAIRRQARRK